MLYGKIIEKQEINILPAPAPIIDKESLIDKEYYSCPQCSSNIEILSIDDKEFEIIFKCLNEDEKSNHKMQKMKINEYIKKIEKNSILINECSICKKNRYSVTNFPTFKYCINCKLVLCYECGEDHINKSNNSGHYLINNNEKNIKCLIHPKNNNIVYCFDCKRHLCKECLKTKEHINHKKNNIYECLPLDGDKKIHKKIIDILKMEIQNLEKEVKFNETNNKNNEEQKKIENDYKNKIESLDLKLKNNLKENEINLKVELEKLERKYKIKKDKIEKKYNTISEEIKNKCNELINKTKKELKEKLNLIKFKNDTDRLNLIKKINDVNALIVINEKIKKTQEIYSDNYYNNINLINTLTSFRKSENKEISQLFVNHRDYNNKDNLNLLNSQIPEASESFQIDFLSKKIKRDKDNSLELENSNNMNHNLINNLTYKNKIDNNKLYENDYNQIRESPFNIEKKNVEIEPSDNKYKEVSSFIENKKEKDIKNENQKEKEKEKNNDKSDNLNNKKEEAKENNMDIIPNINFNKIIVEDAYCSTEIDNSFDVFNSINNNSYIIYATENKSIICYNLSNNKREIEKKKTHSGYISNIKYYYNKYENNEIIMSLSYDDKNFKLWTFHNMHCLLNMKNIYNSGFLYSACVFNINKYSYFAISNHIDYESDIKKADYIKVYNFKGEFIKNINYSKYNSLSIKTYSNKDNLYILSSGDGSIRSYDYNKNELYKKYEDNNNCKIFSFTIFQGIKIIATCDIQNIRIWNFESTELINKIKIEGIKLRGICLYNEKYLLVGCGDNDIKLIDLEKGIIIKSLIGHKEKVCTIIKRNLPNLGKYFFSHAYDDKIIIWKF